MAKRNEGEVSVVPFLWEWSANKEGLHPVKLRITFQRKRMYYSVLDDKKAKLFLSADDYNEIVTTDLKRLKGENRKNRLIIAEAEAKANDAIEDATNKGKDPFSFPEFERRYLGEESGGKFLQYFKKHIQKIESKQAGTARVYSSVLHSFGKFLNNGNSILEQNENKHWVYKKSHKDIDPADITPEKLEKYEDALRNDDCTDTWISICMRTIRTIYNRMAANDEYLKAKYPFSRNDYDDKYKIPVSSGQKGYTMTKDEMATFIKGKVPGDSIPENPYYMAKMLFLFSFYGQGLNFKDMALLKGSNIIGNTIVFERQKTIKRRKTPIVVRIPITKELESILAEIGNPDKRKTSYLFNLFESNKTYTAKQIDQAVQQWTKTTNKWLKKYCQFNSIPEITTYAARHTFASLAKSHLPLVQISKMLGHSKIETTQVYLGRFEDDENRSGLMKVIKSIKKKTA